VAIKFKLDPIEKTFQTFLPGNLSAAERSATLAQFAQQQLGEAQAQNRAALGRVPEHETYVDGRQGAPLQTVRPDGTIIFEFVLLEEVFVAIADLLVKHSPIGKSSDRRPGHPGLYRASHVFTADGVEVDPGAQAPPADEYAFINVQPYARKIEKGLSSQTPDGVYEVVAAMANGRFGNLARVMFGYRAPLFGAVDAWADRTGMARAGNPRFRAEWLRRQPAIIIKPR
jgi:hypothetical protein